MNTLYSLPIDPIKNILHFLDEKSLSNFNKTCKFYSSPFFWSDCRISQFLSSYVGYQEDLFRTRVHEIFKTILIPIAMPVRIPFEHIKHFEKLTAFPLHLQIKGEDIATPKKLEMYTA